jgi:hypothetical protein
MSDHASGRHWRVGPSDMVKSLPADSISHLVSDSPKPAATRIGLRPPFTTIPGKQMALYQNLLNMTD